jgi:hypothetical protein
MDIGERLHYQIVWRILIWRWLIMTYLWGNWKNIYVASEKSEGIAIVTILD